MGDRQHLAHSVGRLAAGRLHLGVGHPDQNRTEARATRHDVGVSWWERVRRKTRRIFSFLALSAGTGLLALWKPLKGAWSLVTSLGALTAAGAVALVLGADVWLTGAVVVSALLVILLVGSFRLWDELDGATEGGGGLHMRASLTTRFQGNVGEPSEVQFDMSMADPLQTVEIQSTSARGKPVAIRFREPCERIVRREDIPKWVRWGPSWRRRQLLVKGFSDTSLLLERIGTIPDRFRMEIYYEDA
jgi:hypothetical protein